MAASLLLVFFSTPNEKIGAGNIAQGRPAAGHRAPESSDMGSCWAGTRSAIPCAIADGHEHAGGFEDDGLEGRGGLDVGGLDVGGGELKLDVVEADCSMSDTRPSYICGE